MNKSVQTFGRGVITKREMKKLSSVLDCFEHGIESYRRIFSALLGYEVSRDSVIEYFAQEGRRKQRAEDLREIWKSAIEPFRISSILLMKLICRL